MDSSVMGRPEEGRIHRLAVNAAPDAISGLWQHLMNPQNRIVAIERHDCDWRVGRKYDHERFLWIKAREVSRSHRHFTDTCCCPTSVRFVHKKAAAPH